MSPLDDAPPTPAAAPLARRRVCRALGTGLGLALAAPLLGGCLGTTAPRARRGDGRLTARPGTPTGSITPGIHPLGLASGRDGWILVPAGYTPERRWPMALFFHGAITPPPPYLEAFRPYADEAGLVVLAPQARAQTWDLVYGAFGPDVAFVDRAMAELFRRAAIDPARLAVSGFSDGGSYALSIGLANGDVLRRVAAYSPGFYTADTRRGTPEFLVTHGTRDSVLPIDATGRPIVHALRELGYSVDFREFDGDHGVLLPLAAESLRWMAADA